MFTHYVGYPPNSDNMILDLKPSIKQPKIQLLNPGLTLMIHNQPACSHSLAMLIILKLHADSNMISTEHTIPIPNRMKDKADADFSWFPLYKP